MIPEIPQQPVPPWLANAEIQRLPLHHLLKNSVYYPACGLDGDPIKYLGGNFHSFVYVDYGVGHDQVIEKINSFNGYQVFDSNFFDTDDLLYDELDLQLEYAGRFQRRRKLETVPPFAFWSIHDRLEGFGPEHGPDRFSLLYLSGDGVRVFEALYHRYQYAPAVVAIIQPGHGFGNNWTNFEDESGPLGQAVMNNPNGIPQYLLYGGWGDGKSYRSPCWSEFAEQVRILHGRLRLWKTALPTSNPAPRYLRHPLTDFETYQPFGEAANDPCGSELSN